MTCRIGTYSIESLVLLSVGRINECKSMRDGNMLRALYLTVDVIGCATVQRTDRQGFRYYKVSNRVRVHLHVSF